jgi:hypothetical protein
LGTARCDRAARRSFRVRPIAGLSRFREKSRCKELWRYRGRHLQVSDIEGAYASIGAGVTVGGGAAGLQMKNGNGVLIKATGTSAGADLKVGPSGMTIKLK